MKTAFISGASRGIGKAIAEALAREGYMLALTCRNNFDRLEEFAGHLHRAYHTTTLLYPCDMSDYRQVNKVAETVLSNFSHLDVLINNAGISHIGLLQDLTIEEWHHIIDTNLSSCFYASKCFLPSMLKRHQGHIISISSIWGISGASCEVAYSTSKGGMNAFTKALAKELAPSGICVNAISCGVIDTDMNACFSKEEMTGLINEIPANRLGSPEDVAATVLGLLKMSYVTGQIIGCDGGYL